MALKFFNRLRRRLLEDGKLSKYFKYALGEIFLVMIGILLALQVNNWNEARKDRKQEQTIYRSLEDNLQDDLADVTDKLAIVEQALVAQKLFMSHPIDSLKEKYTVAEMQDLLYAFSESSRSFFPNTGLYNRITNNNQIDLIRSEELKDNIIELYEQYYKRYSDVDLNIEQQAVFSANNNFFSLIQNYATEYGRYEVDYALLREHYLVLQEECRKMYTLTLLAHEVMNNCKTKIEALLEELQQHVE